MAYPCALRAFGEIRLLETESARQPVRLLQRTAPFAAFTLLSAVAGASLAHALAAPLWTGAVAGAVAGFAPPLAARLVRGTSARRATEQVTLLLLVAVAVAIAVRGMWPALAGATVRVESYMALLLVAPALYWAYLTLNRSRAATAQAAVLDRIGIALSGPPLMLTLALAVTVATCALLLIQYVGLQYPSWQHVTVKFLDRGIIPPLTLVLFFWGLLLLANKMWVLWRERRLFRSAERRSESALVRARTLALQGDDALPADDFMDMVWKKSVDFYVVPRYINWAIPILGFIGTVLGISLAAEGIQSIVGNRGSLSDLSSELGDAIAPLGIAFDTTLIALSLSVFLTLLQTALQRWEDSVLVDYENRLRRAAADDGGWR